MSKKQPYLYNLQKKKNVGSTPTTYTSSIKTIKGEKIMEFDNISILIIGLLVGGMFSLYLGMENIASAIFGGLIGYLAKDPIKTLLKHGNSQEDESVDDEIENIN